MKKSKVFAQPTNMKKLCVILLSIFTVYYSTYKKRLVIIPQIIKITLVYTSTQLCDNTDERIYLPIHKTFKNNWF